ncbi:hypothetical protein INR49_013554, partial [Caranx melampygus]
NYVTGGRCPSKATIPGKTVVITGANTGIGKETPKSWPREVCRKCGRIIMGCRDMEKCEAAAKEIRGNTLNPHVYACHLDLASMKSIREFAKRVKEEEQRVDLLVNNAGVMRCPAWKTEDGFDMQFGVNYLGHFLLTNLLLDKLKESAPSRVINLASLAHIVGKIDFEDLNWEKKKFDTKQAYCQSKLANVLFTRELAKRLQGKSTGCCICTGVTVNAVHPGVVATELGRHTGLHQSQFSSSVLSPFFSLLVKNPELGAQPSVYLAVSEDLEGVTGRYYDVMTEKEPAPQALDEEVACKLWEVSSKLVGLEAQGEKGQTGQTNPPAQGQSKAVQTDPEQKHGQSPGPAVGAAGLDQVAFITGGGSGIGLRIAEIFMRHGCDTVIASRNLDKLREAAKKLSDASGRRCLPLCIDVRQPESIAAAVDETLKELGRIDILINNAAGNFLCPATALSFNAFKTVMEIDTMGTFNTSKVVYEKWFKDHGGNIVNISATLGYKGQALQVHAGSAKAANDAMTKHLAVEWGPSGVRVNTVAPGPISGTEGFRRLGKHSVHEMTHLTLILKKQTFIISSGLISTTSYKTLRQRWSEGEAAGAFQSIPLQRAGNKTEMAHCCLFLASRASSYVSGAILVADGGAWLTSANDVSMLLGIASSKSASKL